MSYPHPTIEIGTKSSDALFLYPNIWVIWKYRCKCGEKNSSGFFFRMIGQRIVEYFVFWHRFRALMRLKLTDELRRKPTSEELFERCAFLFAHWTNLRAHRRRRRTDGPCVRCPLRENVLIHCAPQNLCILV